MIAETSSYESSIGRRDCVADWLRDMTARSRSPSRHPAVTKDRDAMSAAILDAMKAGQVEEAIDKAIDSHPRLALLLATVDSVQARAYCAMQVQYPL